MKKMIATTAALLCLVLTLTLFLETVGLAWLSDNGMSSPIDITSNVHKSYFESGDGTKDIVRDESGEIISGPYEIANPQQLYYFSWLQYLGYFNNVDNNDDNVADTVYFRLSHNINMSETVDGEKIDYKIPPIGTVNNPFIGSFDGEGHTITDLTVENTFSSLLEPPDLNDPFSGAEIIGFFGVIGELKEGDYNYDRSANEVKNVVLENLTVKTQTQNALIGLVAGYVNGTVDAVGVVGSTVDIKSGTLPLSYTTNVSDYALIGYCTNEYKDDVYVLEMDLYDPDVNVYEVVPDQTAGGDGQGWGGSIAMDDMFTFVQAMMSKATNTRNYVYAKTTSVNLDGTSVTLSSETASKKLLYDSSLGASFVFSPRGTSDNSSNSDYNTQYTYLSGGIRVTEYRYDYTKKDVPVYYITDGTYYLNFNGNALSASEQPNTTWYASNGKSGGALTTVVGGTVYYLNVSNGTLNTITRDQPSDATPTWTVSSNLLQCNDYFLYCDRGTWKLTSSAKRGMITVDKSNYLGISGNSIESVSADDDPPEWTLASTNNGYTVSTVVNGTTYYLGYQRVSGGYGSSSYNPVLSTSAQYWKYSDDRLYFETGSGNSKTKYYLKYSNGWTIATGTGSTKLDLTANDSEVPLKDSNTTKKEITFTTKTYVDNTLVKNGTTVKTGITYYPLSVSLNGSTYSTSTGNTGYVISSSYSTKTSDNHETNGTGDIRVSRYTTSSTLTGYTTPYAISYKTNDKFQKISTSTAANYGLVKFNDCYDAYTTSIATNCYGLHFMEATIDIDSQITVEKAQIIGETYYDYPLPTNCVDFTLAEQGFINFVAGAYFKDNNSFFSLHKIERDPQNNITAIKEIDLIYGYFKSDGTLDPNKQYYYTYKNAESDPGMPSGTDSEGGKYDVVFKTDWIINPNSHGEAIYRGNSKSYTYYFEVPVYAGEYALGSAGTDKIGAYLVYLDLAANAQVIERTRVDEMTVTTEKKSVLPRGVAVLEKGDSYDNSVIDPQKSAFVSIGKDFSGSASFTQNGTTVTDSAAGHVPTFVADTVTLLDGNGNEMTVPITKTVTVEKTTYYDTNLVTKVKTVTVIVKTTVSENGSETVGYTKNVTTIATDGKETKEPEKTSPSALYPDVPDPKTNPPVIKIGDKLCSISYIVEDTDDVLVDHEPQTEEKNGNTTVTAYKISVTNNSGEKLNVNATLTKEGAESGITFIITDGTKEETLDADEVTKAVEIAAAAPAA